MKLWLVRHAQPLIAPGVCYGATDVAADPQATQQAAQALALTLPKDTAVTSSPLQRCEQLAHCLQGLRPDLSYKTDSRLAEMNFGCWEGQRWDAIPQADYERWTADFGEHCFGGVESSNQVLTRVASAWTEMQREARDAVWITHAGVIRAASLIARGVQQVEQATQWPQDAPGFGGWQSLEA
ncbi:MAG: histidine phosphatase family protein [Pseudomonadota bacterium]